MVHLSTQDIFEATGVKLSQVQADALVRLRDSRLHNNLRINARTFRVLHRIGLVAAVPAYSFKGKVLKRSRHGLTAAGCEVVARLLDACEYGVDYTKEARERGTSVYIVYKEHQQLEAQEGAERKQLIVEELAAQESTLPFDNSAVPSAGAYVVAARLLIVAKSPKSPLIHIRPGTRGVVVSSIGERIAVLFDGRANDELYTISVRAARTALRLPLFNA